LPNDAENEHPRKLKTFLQKLKMNKDLYSINPSNEQEN